MFEQYFVGAFALIIPFLIVTGYTPNLISYLHKKGWTVNDVNKNPITKVARPGGIIIIIGILSGGIILYVFNPMNEILAILLTTSIAFVIGFVDDRKVMGGWFKPVGLIVAALPIILLGTFDSDMAFPIFGEVNIPILYFGLIILLIPITGNTINSIDVLNGVASDFMVWSGLFLGMSLMIVQADMNVLMMCLVMVVVSIAFQKYHRIPSKIFPGDSGSLTWGAMYGAICIVGGVEIIGAIIILPAVINSFLFLSSTKKIVEHSSIKNKAVDIIDGKLTATNNRKAPVTLVSLIVRKLPLTEKQVGESIFKLVLFSGTLGVISAVLTRFQF